MNSVAYIEQEIAKLEEHDELYGLGSKGKARLEHFKKDLQAAQYQERRNAAEAARTLAQRYEEYESALDESIAALRSYVEAREQTANRAASLEAAKRLARPLGVEIPPADSFGHRATVNTPEGHAIRQLRDRALAVVAGSW